MDDAVRVMRIDIDGRWTVDDMARSCRRLDNLYLIRLYLAFEQDDQRELRDVYSDWLKTPFHRYPRRWLRLLMAGQIIQDASRQVEAVTRDFFERFAPTLEPYERLVIQKIQYESPGFKDVAGIGEVVGHLKDLLIKIIEYVLTRRQRELENEARELDNHRKKLEIAQGYIRLSDEVGYTQKEKRMLVGQVLRQQEDLINLVENGKIRDARVLENQ